MSFLERSARHFVVRKAAREIRMEIEKAGLDNLKALAEANISIIGTYLQGCSPEEKKRHKQEFTALLQLGITPEMVLTEVIRQIPEVGDEVKKKKSYRQVELQKIAEFVSEA